MNTIDPGRGFRLLTDQEPVLPSDEWFDAASNTWKPCDWTNPMRRHRPEVDAPVRRNAKDEGGNLKPATSAALPPSGRLPLGGDAESRSSDLRLPTSDR